MNKVTREIVQEIAAEVRQWAEMRARGCQDLSGWCAIASAQLFRELVLLGIRPEIHMWTWEADDSAHVFLVVEDHVVDVTATQFQEFRRKPIVIMHQREAEVYEFYRTAQVFSDADALRQHQLRTGWPRDQIAYDKLMRWPD